MNSDRFSNTAVVGVMPSVADAQEAMISLREAGITEDQVRLAGLEGMADGRQETVTGSASSSTNSDAGSGGFFSMLFGLDDDYQS